MLSLEKKRRDNLRRILSGAAVVSATSMFLTVTAHVIPRSRLPSSFLYCLPETKPDLKIFAGAVTANGGLRFGLSDWESTGNHLGLWGVARRSGAGWEYQDNMSDTEQDRRCDVRITREKDGSLRLLSVDGAECGGMVYGGAGTSIGNIRFTRKTFEGPVTWQLDDADSFFSQAGQCGR